MQLFPECKDLLLNAFLKMNSSLVSPCGNLSSVYKAKCDQMAATFCEDVAWVCC